MRVSMCSKDGLFCEGDKGRPPAHAGVRSPQQRRNTLLSLYTDPDRHCMYVSAFAYGTQRERIRPAPCREWDAFAYDDATSPILVTLFLRAVVAQLTLKTSTLDAGARDFALGAMLSSSQCWAPNPGLTCARNLRTSCCLKMNAHASRVCRRSNSGNSRGRKVGVLPRFISAPCGAWCKCRCIVAGVARRRP